MKENNTIAFMLDQENMQLIEDLAVQAGATIGSSRPVAETLKYVHASVWFRY